MFSLLALLAGLAAGPSIPPDDTEVEHRYRFQEPAELRDFEVQAGHWVSRAGALQCLSKGPSDSVQWRRDAGAVLDLVWEVDSRSRCSLELSEGGPPLRVLIHREEGWAQVRLGEEAVRELYFDPHPGEALRVRLLLGPRLEIRLGDDEKVELPVDPRGRHVLRLCSYQGQSRFSGLVVRRDGARVDAEAETRSLRLEDARRAGLRGAQDEAFGILLPLARTAADQHPPGPAWPQDLRAALQGLAVREGTLDRWPLGELAAALSLTSRDGSARLALPLTPGWTAEAFPARRIDGILLQIRHREDDLEVELFRYDQRWQYWFGQEPRVQLVRGGDPRALAGARLADLLVEWEGARMRQGTVESAEGLAGQPALRWSLNYDRAPGQDQGSGVRSRNETYARYRGNTLRWSVDGPPDAIQRHADDLAWMLLGLGLEPRRDLP